MPDLTLHGLKDELAARGVKVSHNTVWEFLRPEGLRFKKTLFALEQARGDVARRRQRWRSWQADLDPQRLPGANDAATISRFNASGHDQCRRRSLEHVSITAFVHTSHSHLANDRVTLNQITLRRKAALAGWILTSPDPERFDLVIGCASSAEAEFARRTAHFGNVPEAGFPLE